MLYSKRISLEMQARQILRLPNGLRINEISKFVAHDRNSENSGSVSPWLFKLRPAKGITMVVYTIHVYVEIERRKEARKEARKDWCDPLSERVFKMNESCEPTSVTVSLSSKELKEPDGRIAGMRRCLAR